MNNSDTSILYWGMIPNDQLISDIKENIQSGIKINLKLDKAYQTSINSEGFIAEMYKIQRNIYVPHKLEFTHKDFEIILKPNPILEMQLQPKQTIIGKLELTKGGQALINEILIDKIYFKEKNQTGNWREEVQQYVEKNIKITGDIYIYFSKPEEQTTENNTIKELRNIQSINILE